MVNDTDLRPKEPEPGVHDGFGWRWDRFIGALFMGVMATVAFVAVPYVISVLADLTKNPPNTGLGKLKVIGGILAVVSAYVLVGCSGVIWERRARRRR